MKRLLELITELTQEPWLLTESYHHALTDLLGRAMNEEAFLPFLEGEAEALDYSTDADGVATLNIDGALMRKPQSLERMFGVTPTDQIPETLDRIADDAAVEALILHIDSQGGSVSGVQEAGEAVSRLAADIPVITYTDGMMASAAYWIGSQATAIVASPSARVGSIGVYIPLINEQKRLERMGLSVELIKNREGKYKGLGFTGIEVTGEQRELLQGQVDDIFHSFKGTVLSSRPLVPDSAMQGQTFTGSRAQAQGLVDFIGAMGEVGELARAEIVRNRQAGFFRNV